MSRYISFATEAQSCTTIVIAVFESLQIIYLVTPQRMSFSVNSKAFRSIQNLTILRSASEVHIHWFKTSIDSQNLSKKLFMILGDSFPVPFFCNLNQINLIYSIMKITSKQLSWLVQSNPCFFIIIPGTMSILPRQHRDFYIDGECFQTIFH